MRKFWLVILLAVPLVLVACGGGDDGGGDTEPDQSATPATVTSEPPTSVPTWTPSPEGWRPSPTPPPATWTPQPTREEVENVGSGNTGGNTSGTGSGSSNEPAVQPTAGPTWTPQPDWCYELASISEDFRIQAGQPVTLSWQPVTSSAVVTHYVVKVRHPGGADVWAEITADSTIGLPGDIFNQAVAYGWQIQPLDGDGEPVCFPISGEIVVSFE
ncbi:MAG: hypothetical protein JXQ72_05295 [Anaerolineae bacterium]|nr:hypothetical protein [Anaerolineae bacterium]